MCDTLPKVNTAKVAAQSLAHLIERELGYHTGHIDPIALRLFIRSHWSKITTLAHTIHSESES